jgi:transposase
MKYALMQAAANAVRLNPRVKAYYEFQKDRRRGSGGKMVSLNIIARKLAMAVWHCFHGKPFDEKALFNLEGLQTSGT